MKILRIYANIRPVLIRKPVLIVLEVLAVFLLTIVADRLLGIYFEKSLFFKAYRPNSVVKYETSEMKFDATISAQGLRNEKVRVKREKGTTRIMAIGDSFTWGWGVDAQKAWPKALEAKFKESGYKVEVINAGVHGIGQFKQTRVCQDYINVFKPDLIVLGFYSTEDILQNYGEIVTNKEYFKKRNFPINKIIAILWPHFAQLKEPRYVVPLTEVNENGVSVSSPNWKKSVNEYLKDHGKLPQNISQRALQDFVAGKLNPSLVQNAQLYPDYLIYVLDEQMFSQSLQATELMLSDVKKCSGKIPIYAVLIPSEEIVHDKYFIYRREIGFNVDERLLTFDLDSHLEPIFKKLGFDYVSLLSDFRSDGCLDCYYPYDSHMTEVGHRRVAKKVYMRIRCELEYANECK